MTYTALEKKKTPILCESYHFNTIGAFLYIELFKGLEQHYAWYLKKKMSQSEFQKWADYALELRQHALDWVLDLEEYRRIIRE